MFRPYHISHSSMVIWRACGQMFSASGLRRGELAFAALSVRRARTLRA